MKFFITCVPCCQSTKSVCHCCTTKISIQFLPLSKKYSNCVKHSLPERRLYTIVPDIHSGWSIKKALHSSLNNSFSASSYVFLDQHSIFSREIPSQAREIKTFVIGPPIQSLEFGKAMCKDEARLTVLSRLRFHAGTPPRPGREIPSRAGQVKTFGLGPPM